VKIIENAKIIANDKMEIINRGYIIVDGGKIREINSGSSGVSGKKINAKHCLAIPGLINAHTHVGDSIAKEAGLGKTLFELVTPPSGFKHKMLRETPKKKFIRPLTILY
jgi:cytosine/adenosine deaminase-related metal-dependent hydrolase